jgi:hypothetical protein
MCCGVGNLEVKHSNHRNIYMSTLDAADVDVMKATKTCVAAQRIQYDYLNDDITDDGKIDYSLTNKVPEGLRKAITDGKKILVLINPPYAEAGNTLGKDSKDSVAKTKFASVAMNNYGKSSVELFTQFIARVAQEIPTATLAMFSKLKYVNAPNFEKFRQVWNAIYLGGFVVHSKSFDGLKGDFPIGFLVWKTNQNSNKQIDFTTITTDVLDKNAKPIGEKTFYNLPPSTYLNLWVKRPKSNKTEAIPLKNAILPATANVRLSVWSDNAVGFFWCKASDMQNVNQTVIFSSPYSQGDGFFINEENLWQVAVIFTVRRIVKPMWISDRDQFLQPTGELTEEFKSDCLIWMLFNGSNLTAGADDLEWNGRKWSVVNHFIPFTEAEVGAPGRFESDFMVQYINNLPPIVSESVTPSDALTKVEKLSPEATAVLAEGKKLWQAYFSQTDVRSVRDELKLNRPDAGWYQVRKALQARNASGDFPPVSFKHFETAYKALTEKLQPMVYELGFLKL